MRNLLWLALVLATFTLSAQDKLYFPDHPSLTPDGSEIFFSYATDIWRVPAAGGVANRVTALDGSESRPKVSPDGKWLAFSSSQYGNNDVYLMPVNGGAIKQLTFHEASDAVATWSWDSKEIYFVSSRYNRVTTYTVSVSGGTPKRVVDHYFNDVHNPAIDPVSGALYFNESGESYSSVNRKRYKGPFNPEIKSLDLSTKKLTVHTDYEGKDMWPMIDRQGNVFFVSDRGNDEYNLYQMTEGKPKRLSRFKTSVFNPSIAADGSAITFIKDYQLQHYDVKSGKSRTVPVTLGAFAGLAKTADFSTDRNVTFFDVAYDGKKIAFVSRGELFVSDMAGKFIRQLQTGPDRVAEVKWLKDNKTLVFTQTVGGYQNLHTIAADGSGKAKVHTRDERNNRGLEISADSSRLVYLSGRDEIRVMDLEDFSVETVAKQEIWGFQTASPVGLLMTATSSSRATSTSSRTCFWLT